jgi:hypothetical protein
MFDVHLLAAGFSAILGVEVVHPDAGKDLPKLSIHSLFHLTYIPVPLESVDSGELFDIYIKTLTGHTTPISVTKEFTIAHVKAALEEKENIPACEQRLVFSSKSLDDDETIGSAGIPCNGTIYLVIKLRGGGAEFQLDMSELEPQLDYDFTKASDDGKKYMRGKFEYHRPYGWYRYALKVTGKYGSDDWLGPGGIRTQTSAKEWPVSYHGTNMKNAKGITKEGFSLEKSHRFKFGKGIYSSPHISVAQHYSQRFEHKGRHFDILLQNRTNPEDGHLVIMNDGQYWISPKQDPSSKVFDIRPYGVLIKPA